MSNWNKRYASQFNNLHEEIEAYKAGVNLDNYDNAKDAGATHNEVMQAHKSGVDVGDYGYARYNATHDEAIQAHKSGVDVGDYGYARYNGATHDEAMQAHKSGVNLFHYGYARYNGATHNEVMQAHKSGVDLFHYCYARRGGATHDEAMQAHKLRNHLENMWDRESPTQEELGPYLGSKNESTHKMSNWYERYANKEYEDARNEYLQKFIRPGKKDTPEAKKFYREKVLTKKPKPAAEESAPQPEDEQLSFEGMPEATNNGTMSWEDAMKNPHFDGQDWMPGTKGPRII